MKLSSINQRFYAVHNQNQVEHAADCARSCELFYCADDLTTIEWDQAAHNDTSFASYSFGSVPPEDFSDEFQ